jgi:hypothetical protein
VPRLGTNSVPTIDLGANSVPTPSTKKRSHTEEVESSATTYTKTPKQKANKKLFVQGGVSNNQSGYSDSDSESDSDSAPTAPRARSAWSSNSAPSYVDKPLTQQRK